MDSHAELTFTALKSLKQIKLMWGFIWELCIFITELCISLYQCNMIKYSYDFKPPQVREMHKAQFSHG